LEEEVEQIEERCESLVRRQHWLRPAGIANWPDGTVTGCYAFRHWLYQHTAYLRLGTVQCIHLHRRIGIRSEAAYSLKVGEVAAELALHFERGRDSRRAIQYLRQAAENATRRYANREAVGYLTRALALVALLPEAEQVRTHMAVLGQRGLVYRAMGDMRGAAEDFTTLAGCAREQGQINDEVKALLASVSALSWVDRQRCLATLEQAMALSPQLTDEVLRAHTRGYWGHWYSRFCGWREEDAQACIAAMAAARQAGEHTLLSLHVGRYCYYQCLRSDYRGACRTAEEGSQLALEAGDAFEYLYCQLYQAWALLHLGQWGDMLRVLSDGTQMAEKNEHRLVATLFRLERALLHIQAGDWVRAHKLGAHSLMHAQEAQHETTQCLSLIILGLAHLRLGNNARAFHCFSDVTRRLERDPMAMEWMFQMPLRQGLSAYWLTQHAFRAARQDAEQLCELAAQSEERTYLALGWRMLAKIALAERHWDRAEAALSQALTALDGVEAPLAAWRVYATAAQVHQQCGRHAEAARCWGRSMTVLGQLADALGAAVELRQALRSQPSVQTIFYHARAGV